MSLQEFIEMGGYGGYIWSSYAIGLIVFVLLFVSVKSQRKNLITQLRRRYRLNDQQFKQNSEKNTA